jgi:aspartyl-tRNA(Asn)/glutamyl-tRNA(Gln) amidotransferase subunit A
MPEPNDRFPRLFPGPDETIAGIGRALREGRATCVAVLEECLRQVEFWEPRVHAWVLVDRAGALKQAHEFDAELKAGNDRGPLHGIPIGIKDLIDVQGLPTACGTKRWAHRVADSDAEVVKRLRAAGAVILGKTVTTPYAWIDPPVTRNPWNLERTSGGSSSGSAAAAACGACYGAIGSQTGGSITRPASFCGVCGMKPTYGALATQGIAPLARSLDHVGPIARTVEDLRSMYRAMYDESVVHDKEQSTLGPSRKPIRLGRLRGYFDRLAGPAMRSAFDQAIGVLASSGAEIIELEDPINFEQVVRDHRRVMAAEAAAYHSDSLSKHPDDYPPRIRELLLEGRGLTAIQYLQAADPMGQAGAACRTSLARLSLHALITPATIGTAPDPSATGDPAFNSPWSYTHLPTVSFPIGLAADGLPLAVQLVGWSRYDENLLQTAAWCEDVIRAARQ